MTQREHPPNQFPGFSRIVGACPAAFCRELPIVALAGNAKVFDLLGNRWWAL